MLNHCTNCSTAYAADLQACPHCRQPANTVVTELVPAPVGTAEAEPAKRRARREPPVGTAEAAATDA